MRNPFSRQPAAPAPDPTRTTWTVQMTGTCGNGHQVSTTVEVSARNGALGQYAASGKCSCSADAALTGWVG